MNEDWRLMGQEKYLKGSKLKFGNYGDVMQKSDHDHCEFCFAKFMVHPYPDTLQEGYYTLDKYRWICKTCYEDFKSIFLFEVL